MRSLTLVAVILLGALPGLGDEGAVFSAENADPPGAPVGERPYEMVWAGRDVPEHAQTADFEDLTGWRVRCFDGAEAKLYRSQQERCFGEYTARVEYSGNTAISRFIVEPSSPIEIPGAITAANLWVRGNNWGFDDPPPTPRVNLRILVQDAKGETYRINIGVVDFDYWSVMHQTFVEPATGTLNKQYVTPEGAADADIDLPAKFIGIEVVGCSGKKPARLHFDALSLYEIQYPPLTFAPIPETLPWPTTPDTILPALTDPPASDSSAPPAIDGDFTWAAKYERDIVRYAYTPKSGTLSDIVAEAGGQVFYPCWKGCVGFEVDGAPMRPDDEGVTVQCKRAAYEDGVVIADWVAWRNEGHPVTYRYTMQLKGKSLIVDVEAEGGMATRLDIGLAKGLNAAKAVYIPYLTYGGDWPRVACSTSNGVNVFLLSLLDYYNSDASELFGAPQIQADDALGYAGGAIYRPKTDAKRNNLRERIFINVSSDVHEVLPSIPNPDCDTGDIARECVWRNVGQLEPEMMAQYKAYGIDKFIACHHEVGWRDAGESFTMRLEAAPRYGDQGLADYGKWMRETLGYRFGTYTNYVDFAPVNSNWNEDDVCLDPDGTWQRAWPRTYAIKPLRAVEKEAYYAPRIHEKFGTNAQYCDVHTAYSPWGRTDYDARTPGAGKFRTQFDSFARLLWNESIAHGGPVFSEGNHHWFYAGIVDGNYATMLPYGEGYRVPPIVDFDLLKMHTKMTDFGMGFGDMFFGMRGSWKEDTSRLSPYYDRFIASTIAFGHIGFLTYEWGFDGTLKSYYQLQALQQRYTMIPVQEIRYFNGEELVDTSTAIATDAYRMQQIYTKYESGLEVWSNLSFGNDWTIVVDGIVYTLPPASFVAFKAGDILEYSATLEGQRHELVQCADYLYLDTRGALVRTPMVATRGQVAVKRDGDAAWWIIPCPEAEAVTVSTDWLGRDAGYRFEAAAHDEAGNVLGACEVRHGMSEVTVMPYEGATKYHLSAVPAEGLGAAAWRAPEKWVQKPAWRILPASRERDPATSRLRIQGNTVSMPIEIDLPETVDPAAFRVRCGDADVALSRDQAGQPVRAILEFQVPQDAPEFARHWVEAGLVDGNGVVTAQRWFDVTVVPAFEAKVLTNNAPLQPGQPFDLEIGLMTNVPDAGTVHVQLVGPTDWTVSPPDCLINPSPGSPIVLQWQLQLGQQPIVEPFTLRIAYGDKVQESVRYLRTRPTEWVAADLSQSVLDTGVCIRGQKEIPLDPLFTGATAILSAEVVGGENKRSLFMHPPYQHGVGYTFATFNAELPKGTPYLEFDLGFREGSTTQDGCVFKVHVLADGREEEVFSEQYATLGAWAPRRVNLSAYADRGVTLKFIADAGPADNSYSDWPCWGAPRITLGGEVMTVEVFDTEPQPTNLLAPEPLPGLTVDDLKHVAQAELTFDSAGVNQGEYTSYITFNGIDIGPTPVSGADTEWHPSRIELTSEAIKTLQRSNKVVIRNPGRDFMKVRSFCLHFTLEDGRRGSSWVDIGPYTSATGWPFGEGICVPVGANLPLIRLNVQVE